MRFSTLVAGASAKPSVAAKNECQADYPMREGIRTAAAVRPGVLRLATLMGLCLMIIALPASALRESAPDNRRLIPSPSFKPAEVVKIQVHALQHNTALNEGIKLTFTFASPQNKAQTGPLESFVSMVRSAPYDRLVNHASARFSTIQVLGDEASQRVTVRSMLGEESAFLWLFSRQSDGKYADCWMTDAVIPLRLPVVRRLTLPMMRIPSGARLR